MKTVQIPQYVLDDSPVLAKKIREYQDAEATARATIALVAPAQEVEQLRLDVQRELEQAREAGDACQVECTTLRNRAKAEAKELVEFAHSDAKDLLKEAEHQLATAAQELSESRGRMTEAKILEAELAEREEGLQVRVDALEARKQQHDALAARLAQQQSDLESVREHMASILDGGES